MTFFIIYSKLGVFLKRSYMFTKYSTLAILATLMLSACQAPMPHNNQLRLSTNHAPKNSVALENAAAKVLTTGLEAPWDMALGCLLYTF